MIQLAKQHNIEIFWFYREDGYGKGLVDAMSSFGCKKVLRSAIITEGRWFRDTFFIYEYLYGHFHYDDSKSYYCIDEKHTASKRRSVPLKGCQQHTCIAVNPYGEFMTRNILDIDDDSTFEFKFMPTYGVCSDDEDSDAEVDDKNEDQNEVADRQHRI